MPAGKSELDLSAFMLTNLFADYPMHPPAKDLERYFEAYAKHFDLIPRIQFSTTVDRIERDETNRKWVLFTSTASS